MIERGCYEARGLAAIEPSAIGTLFDLFARNRDPFRREGAAAVVTIDGPLETAGWLFDNYDNIRARVAQALASDAECVVLKVASPGGDVFGCFDTARALRGMARAAGKKLYGFTEGMACSAAYALISAADEISVSESGVLGSIGVIATLIDASEQIRSQGLKPAIITSGKRKADGNPMIPLSKEAREAAQDSVDAMAGVFFALVREHRGIDARPLEAGTFVGAAAKEHGLADRVESFDQLLARLAIAKSEGPTLSSMSGIAPSASAKAADAPEEEKKKDADARAALKSEADSDDPKKAARAKKALAAYDEKDEEKASAEFPPAKDDEKKDDDKKDAKKAKAEASSDVAATAALGAELAARDERILALEAEARDALFASRPDLSEGFRKACATMSIPQLKELLAATPAPKGAPAKVAAAETAAPTRGIGQGSDAPSADRLPKAEAQELDRLMGIASYEKIDAVDTGVVQSFGVQKVKG
jgi:ClpP class serine protease